jgi:hypothetical protein
MGFSLQCGPEQNTRTLQIAAYKKVTKHRSRNVFAAVCTILINIVSDSSETLDWKIIEHRNATYTIVHFVHLKINCATL